MGPLTCFKVKAIQLLGEVASYAPDTDLGTLLSGKATPLTQHSNVCPLRSGIGPANRSWPTKQPRRSRISGTLSAVVYRMQIVRAT